MDIVKKTIDVVKDTIKENNLIESGDHVILGLSGGPDSTCLFHILNTISKEFDFELNAVHVNHGIRPRAAAEDCEFVKELCSEYDVPLKVFDKDVQKISETEGLSLEEAGRNARYDAFSAVAQKIEGKFGVQQDHIKIATAHNQNDQVETLLMRIVRGTGVSGLSGIPSKRVNNEGYAIIRPLIEVPREDIEAYCLEEELNPVIDETNKDVKYTRNRARHKLLPVIKEEFGESSVDSILRLSSIVAEQNDFFDTLINEAMENECDFVETSDGEIISAIIPLKTLCSYHPAIRHRLIVSIFDEIGLYQDIASVHLTAADDLIMKGETGKAIDFPKEFKLEISYDDVFFKSPDTNIGFSSGNSNSFDTETEIFEVEYIEFDAEALEKIGIEPVWRTRLPGDRIRPEGMNGSKKLQDLFVDIKMPREKREKILVLAQGDNILWIPGIRKSRDFPVTENTGTIRRFAAQKNKM